MRSFLSSLFLLLASFAANAQVIKTGGASLSVSTTPPSISVSTSPSISTVTVSATQDFTATILNDTQNAGVFWTLEGPACLGVTCGTISNSTSINGGHTTYTAPSSVPSNPTVFLIAASVTDPTKFVTSTITIFQSSGGGGGGGTTPAPMVLNNRTPLNANVSSSHGPTVFNFTPLQGALLDVFVFLPSSGGNVSSITDPNGDVFTQVPCQADQVGIGHVQAFNAFNAKIGTSSITVNWSTTGSISNFGVIIRDISNNSSVNQASATCGGTTALTMTPSGPGIVAAAGSLVLSGIQVGGNTQGTFTGVIPPPFTVSTAIPGYGIAGGTDLAASTDGTYSPNWQLATPQGWAGITEAFFSGSGSSPISVAITPPVASVNTSATQTFTATVSNDATNSGVIYTLTGAGCSGATCGSLTTGSVMTLNGSVTSCGNTVAATMTCTLAAPSVGNTQFLGSGTGLVQDNITKIVDNKGSTWVQAADCKDTLNGDRSEGWYAANTTPGITSLTLTVSPDSGSLSGFVELHEYDYSGGNPINPLSQGACQNNGASTTNQVGPTVTETLGGGAINAGIQASNGVSSIDAPFTYDDDHVAHALNASPGTFNPSWHSGVAGTWAAFTVALQPSSISTGSVLYTAPGSVPSPALVTLTATSVKDPTKSASAFITVGGSPVIGVSVAPTNSSTTASGATISYIATVTNDGAGVTWKILNGSTVCSTGCGSLASSSSASGASNVYTPPATLSASGNFFVQACSITAPTTCFSASLLVSPATGPAQCGSPCPAFPGAQGSAATTPGGRGGVVYNVTSLADTTNSACAPFSPDTTTCTLRDCIQASGARTCVFRLGGAIVNTKRLAIGNPLITIAGQTTPGGPITVHSAVGSGCTTGDCGTFFTTTHDIIIRYMTYDGLSLGQTGPDVGTVGFEFSAGSSFIMVDHTTKRWWGNKVDLPITNGSPAVHNITTQWNLLYEPNIGHPVIWEFDTTCGAPGCSALASVNDDYHHNMGVNFFHRWPLTNIRSLRFVSNLTYNWGQDNDDFLGMSWGGIQVDYISNRNISGPQTVAHAHPFLFLSNPCNGNDSSDSCPSDNPGPPSIYLLNNIGNICDGQVKNSCQIRTTSPTTHVVNDTSQLNQIFQGTETAENNPGQGPVIPVPGAWLRSTPLTAETFPITPDPAETLVNTLTPTVGNSQHLDCTGNFVNNRDSQDTRIISEVLNNGSGAPIGTTNGGTNPSPNYNGPTVNNGANPSPVPAHGTACVSTLHDGIPDAWRNLYHITAPQNAVDQATGYTRLEEYLDGVVPSP